MHAYPNQAMRSTAAQLLAIFFASFLYCGVTNFSDLTNWDQMLTWITTPQILLSLFWTGVITTALTVYMETVALETLSAAETTLIFSTEPLFGAACATVVMNEQLGLDAGIGAFLILSGCLFANLGIDGIKSFFKKKSKNGNGRSNLESPSWLKGFFPKEATADDTPETSSAASRLATQAALFRTGLSVTTNEGNPTVFDAWNQLAIGAKVTMLQIGNFFEELLPEEWLIDL